MAVSDGERRNTFERFRRYIHGIGGLTFDELFQRARFIIQGGFDSPSSLNLFI